MAGFDDIVIGWKGVEYKVPPEKALKMLGTLEEIIAPGGGDILSLMTRPHASHLTKLARAYATALRFGGAAVTDEEVYLSLQKEVMQGGTVGFAALTTLGQGLLGLFFPDWASQESLARGDGSDAKVDEAGND